MVGMIFWSSLSSDSPDQLLMGIVFISCKKTPKIIILQKTLFYSYHGISRFKKNRVSPILSINSNENDTELDVNGI